jgi:hypothetical protein
MSKVISFSISDRYLDKLRSLYPSLTDNLAVKQFVTDGLDGSLGNSLDVSLDDGLDDRVKTLIESWVDGLLEVRLDASVGKLITSLSERMARLEERLDDSLDGRLDDMEPLLKREKECSIATAPIPTGETSPDEPVQPAIGTVTPEVSPSPPLPPDAIEDSEKKIIPLPDTLIGSPIGIDEIVSTDSSIKSATDAIETDDREWLTLQQIADKKIKGLPGTHQGLSPYAENWESRKNPTKKGKQYKIPREYLTPISPNPD